MKNLTDLLSAQTIDRELAECAAHDFLSNFTNSKNAMEILIGLIMTTYHTGVCVGLNRALDEVQSTLLKESKPISQLKQ